MKNTELRLSLNEVLFFFTRAAVGAGASFGLSEDFGRTSIWLASNGLDPAQLTLPALNTLAESSSIYSTEMIDSDQETHLKLSSDKNISAIQAGPTINDWIASQSDSPNSNRIFVAENVDFPFLIAAALGAAGCWGWDVTWQDSVFNQYLIRFKENGDWIAYWNGNVSPEFSEKADVTILPENNSLSGGKIWSNQVQHFADDHKKVLQAGVLVQEQWPNIRAFFDRCLVPSTQQSLESGAGAGLVDTD